MRGRSLIGLLMAVLTATITLTACKGENPVTGPTPMPGGYYITPASVTLGEGDSATFTVVGEPVLHFDWGLAGTLGKMESTGRSISENQMTITVTRVLAPGSEIPVQASSDGFKTVVGGSRITLR